MHTGGSQTTEEIAAGRPAAVPNFLKDFTEIELAQRALMSLGYLCGKLAVLQENSDTSDIAAPIRIVLCRYMEQLHKGAPT